jgi:hypothetical protein
MFETVSLGAGGRDDKPRAGGVLDLTGLEQLGVIDGQTGDHPAD